MVLTNRQESAKIIKLSQRTAVKNITDRLNERSKKILKNFEKPLDKGKEK